MTPRLGRLAWGILALLLLPGCGDSPVEAGVDPEPDPPADPFLVGPEGGAIVHAGSGLELRVPPGALSTELRITIQQASGASAPGDPGRVGGAWILGPTGPAFDPPAVLALPVSAADRSQAESLVLVRAGGTGYMPPTLPEGESSGALLSAAVTGLGTFWLTRGRGIARQLVVHPMVLQLEVTEEHEGSIEARDLLGSTVEVPPLHWTVGDSSVVQVGDGRLRGLRPGTTTVSIRDEGGLATAQFSVQVAPQRVMALEWLDRPDSMEVGRIEAVRVLATDARGNVIDGAAIEWGSSDPGVLEVRADGTLRARSVGTSNVTARARTGEGFLGLDTEVKVVRAPGGLRAEDHDRMVEALDGLYDVDFGSPWTSQAAQIIRGGGYNGAAWEVFFREYFATRHLNANLRWYLQHVAVHWDGWPREALQAGLTPVLLEHLGFALDTPLAGFATQMAQDEAYRHHMYALAFMLGLLVNQPTGFPARVQVAEGVRALAESPRELLDLERDLPGDARWAGPVRTQVATILAEAADDFGWVRSDVADWVGLSGARRTIYEVHGTLINDSGLGSARQVEIIASFLGLVPEPLLNLIMISIDDLVYGPGGAPQGAWITSGRAVEGGATRSGVNIFGVQPGAITENPFPDDVPGHGMDLFTAALAHEGNHVVDCCSVRRNAHLRAWMWRLLDEAGDEPKHFLRSMLPRSFFRTTPQEFFASISNQWFGNSRRTVELGLVRAEAGIPHPLHQALFMAEVYSLGGGTTYFYETDVFGNVLRHTIPLERDGHGNIRELRLGDVTWRFTRYADGSVLTREVVPGG